MIIFHSNHFISAVQTEGNCRWRIVHMLAALTAVRNLTAHLSFSTVVVFKTRPGYQPAWDWSSSPWTGKILACLVRGNWR